MAQSKEQDSKNQRENDRPTRAIVDLAVLAANYRAIAAHVAPAQVMPILKANAYGHGLIECARKLEAEGAKIFGVAFLEEALALRQAGITAAILALGGLSGRQLSGFLDHSIDITASSISKLETVDEAARQRGVKARVHLKIDTGMERIGTHYYSAEGFLEAALKCKAVEIAGIFSHFATSELEDQSFARLQLERFLEVTEFFNRRSVPMPQRHMANSGSILSSRDYHLDLVRPGASLYGVSPAPHLSKIIPVKPCLAIRSEVVYFKVVKAGAGVSYNLTWHAPQQTRVVTIPLGYGDGYSRLLSHKSSVLIRGKRYPIVGTICMDQFMVDIGPDGIAYNGDEVMILGTQGNEHIGVEDLAQAIGTNPREVLVALNTRIPRKFIG